MPISALSDLSGNTLSLLRSAGVTVTSGRLSAWADQSGNGNDPTFASAGRRPWAGTRASLGFDGTGTTTRLDLPAGVPIDKQSLTIVLIGALNGIGQAGSGGLIFGFDDPSFYCQLHGNQLEFPLLPLASIPIVPTSPCVFILRLSGSASKLLLNGKTYSAAAATAGARAGGDASIGNSPAANYNTNCPLAVSAIGFFSRALSDGEVDEVVAYAQTLEPNISLAPATRIVVDGDSIAFGYYGNGTGTGYASVNDGWVSLLDIDSSIEVVNVAVPAQSLVNEDSDAVAQVDPLATADGVTAAIYIEAGGSNDIEGGASAATTYSRKVAQCQGRTDAGFAVLVTTILPRVGRPAVADCNGLSRADFESTPVAGTSRVYAAKAGTTYALYLVDVAANPSLDDSSDTTYFFDGVHPTGQGHVAYAADVNEALGLLLTPPDTTPPTLSSPTASATGQTTADLSVTTDEDNGTLYTVVTTSGTAPTATQVKAGQDHAGIAAAYDDSQSISNTGVKTFSATGLIAATTYHVHFMHEDAAGNQSSVVSSSSFTTDSEDDVPAAPTTTLADKVLFNNYQIVDLGGPGTIQYTINGHSPICSRTVKTYSKPFAVDQNLTVRAIALVNGAPSAERVIKLIRVN